MIIGESESIHAIIIGAFERCSMKLTSVGVGLRATVFRLVFLIRRLETVRAAGLIPVASRDRL